jgi:predicted CXXCH cytochrome family protein
MTASRVLAAVAALVVLAPLAFVVTDRTVYHFERRNEFCVSCHLHERLLATFEQGAETARDLSAVHFTAMDFPRCIECHKGEGTIERAKVLAVAGRDALKYLAGVHEEPDHSDVPIADAGCTSCHATLGGAAAGGAAEFHRRAEHTSLPMRCVACHVAHKGGDPAQSFLVEAQVVPVCRRCHATM